MIPEWMFAGAFLAGLLTGLGLLWRRSALVEHLQEELRDLSGAGARVLDSANDVAPTDERIFLIRLKAAQDLLARIEARR